MRVSSWSLTYLPLLWTVQFCSGVPLPHNTTSTSVDYDVVIIGGGPAGLSALSGLARVRRKALLIDSGEYRNALTRHAHDIIGLDGVTPAWLRYAAREGIAKYPTATMINGTVQDIQSVNDGSYFSTSDDQGRSWTSSMIVLAIGIKDILPLTPGIAENWSRGIYWCPWCDGYEHRDQPFGILANLSDVLDTVKEIKTLNSDTIAFVNGTLNKETISALDAKSPGWMTVLDTWGVKLENRTISAIKRLQDGGIDNDPSTQSEFDRFSVEFTEGPAIERNAFISGFAKRQRSYLGQSLGVNVTNEKIQVDLTKGMVTNIVGVYGVGDANSDGSTNVPHAMWSGKRAAVSIHLALSDTEAAAVLEDGSAHHKRRSELTEEIVFDLMGREVEELWESKQLVK